jgi:bis(5'-nucleosyl)-tetraphosphatase (symmetrical)
VVVGARQKSAFYQELKVIYAIGDVQGCYTELLHLLDKISFDPARDQLWFVGDLVNRGPDSLSVLRLVKSLGSGAITVLGNHDLHLLAVAQGLAKLHSGDTLDEILRAPDCDELLTWLRHQAMLHVQDEFVLVHAGLLPNWSVPQARQLAAEVEAELRGSNHADFLAHMYGNQPATWEDELSGYARLRIITNALTRMRICTPEGEMEFKFKGEQHKIPTGYTPWFDVPGRGSQNATVIFGHWSALGLLSADNYIALDTGCLWGGPLTAIRLEDRAVFQVPSVNPVAANHEL